MSSRNPAEEGIQAAKRDNARAREVAAEAELAKRRDNGAIGPVRGERNTRLAASGSANAINRAIGHLEAAISELAEAGARAEAAHTSLDTNDEEVAHAHALELLDHPEEGLIPALKHLRDRRAARAGFSFDEEV